MPVKDAIQQFLDYCELDRNLSQKTIRMYSYYLEFFNTWLANNFKDITINIELLTDAHVRRFRLFLAQQYKNPYKGMLKRQSQNYFLIALRSLLRYLVREEVDVLSPDKILLGKVRDREIKFLSPQDLEKLCQAPNIKTQTGLRDKAIIEVLFSTGLRVAELASLDRDRINLDTREFNVIGKGGRARVVFLSKRAALWLGNYLKKRKDEAPAVFIRYKGKKVKTLQDMRLSPRHVERVIEKYRRTAGITTKITPHVLRHSFATDLLMHGADIRSVQEMLGHKNIATTQIYTHVTNPHLRDIHDKFHSGND